MRTLTIFCIAFGFLACSKHKADNSGAQPSIAFYYVDNQIKDTMSAQLTGGYIQKGVDPLSGSVNYIFHVDGPSGSTLHFSFETLSLSTNVFGLAAFSSGYPGPLTGYSWEYRDGTLLQPDSVIVDLNVDSDTLTAVSGAFSAYYRNGSFFASVMRGSFTNLPIRN